MGTGSLAAPLCGQDPFHPRTGALQGSGDTARPRRFGKSLWHSIPECYYDVNRKRRFDELFAGYRERYVRQIPAQAFDQANENFFRTTFYELCTRYLSRHFHFAIEVNSHAGRSDWQAVGRKGSKFEGQGYVIEFKHFTRQAGERRGILNLAAPLSEDAAQVARYAEDLHRAHPELTIAR
ncbi:MAG: PD-(D/E)XK nuclease domain-containing protein, partial [Kiritimatiellaeota bacterium]|nr:PD-(D/E)XK nuclease domain-containing protein [Kiritimatiellota bacterium]